MHHPLLLKMSYLKLAVFSFIFILILLGSLSFIEEYMTKALFTVLSNLLIAILTCVLVSFWWNRFLLDASNHYSKSGIKNYYNDFSDVESEIKLKLKETQNATIFVMHGKSFFSSSTSYIKEMLSNSNNKLTIIIANPNNPFIREYQRFWGENLEQNIESVEKSFKKLYDEIDSDTKGRLTIYNYNDGIYCYSYYMLDDELYFSPNKMVESKTFKPMVIHSIKTKDKSCLYEKLSTELESMKKSDQVKVLFDSNEITKVSG